MANFTRLQVIIKMWETGIIPIFHNLDLEICKKILTVCYNAGIRVFEFTDRSDFAHEIFTELSKHVYEKLPEIILGAGSITDAETAVRYMQTGANFIVSPVMSKKMAFVCNRRKVLWLPGCGTLTEIVNAEELGAEVVKIFPAIQMGGPDFIKSIKGPRPHSNIMPTGGIKPEKHIIQNWIKAGAWCIGMGSELFIKYEDGKYNIDEIAKKCRQSIEWVYEVRQE
ncbi:MAG: bifunctional 4-hydroxy-2-oxoglutarate aldolase/2-dehydro-3-deoxy-phosphogluconate aldolase [Desulfamplus sp.]|nr:bifunctional 4-hydroxy-2-oxoglutarate aldolase/2-dehydro-3-deoxy-phosphogluconate aldolase [Desulfamplus sp.]